MDKTYLKNVKNLKDIFKEIKDKESRYLKIIELGKTLPPFPSSLKIKKNKVGGCQSITYISSKIKNNKIEFLATSDALISKGLAAILILAYKNVTPNVILNTIPQFLNELEIQKSLSPSRATGLLSMYEKMKEEANKYIKN